MHIMKYEIYEINNKIYNKLSHCTTTVIITTKRVIHIICKYVNININIHNIWYIKLIHYNLYFSNLKIK